MVQSSNPINNSVGAEISGVTNSFTVFNDSDTASSQARTIIAVGGTSAGDPWLNFKINGTDDWSIGIDNDDADKLKISQGSVIGTNDTWNMTTAGERTLPLQPMFNAYVSVTASNVTGDGTSYTVIFDTEVFDIGSNYDSTTGIFTAPIDGHYLFCTTATAGNISSSHTQGLVQIVCPTPNARVYEGNYANVRSSANRVSAGGSIIQFLSATQTAHVMLRVLNSTKTVSNTNQAGGGDTDALNVFSGFLLG